MLPKEYEALIGLWAEDQITVLVEAIELHKGSLDVIITASTDETFFRWKLIVPSPLDYHLRQGHVDKIRSFNDHPLLWDFIDHQSSLYFTGSAQDPAALSLALIQAHDEVFQGTVGHARYLRPGPDQLRTSTYGLLAEGPVRILDRYAGCLKGLGMRTTMVGTRPPVMWTKNGWQSVERAPALLSFGENWIVATTFEWTLAP